MLGILKAFESSFLHVGVTIDFEKDEIDWVDAEDRCQKVHGIAVGNRKDSLP